MVERWSELVDRARCGDREAFREIVEGHQGRVYALARSWVRNSDEAEDIVQEVFLKAYRSLDGFRGRAKLSSWLHRITVNTCLDAHRGRRWTEVQEPPAEDVEEVDLHPDADPQRGAESQGIRRAIGRAVLGLTPAERSVFVLRHYSELSTRETAEALGKAEGTVKNLLFRALRKLQSQLEPYRSTEVAR